MSSLLNWLLLGLFDDDEDDYTYDAYEAEMAEWKRAKKEREEPTYDGRFEKPRHIGARAFFILTILWALIIGYGVANIVAVWIYPNTGNLQLIGIEAYWDAELTTPVTDLDWGVMEAGEIKHMPSTCITMGTEM